MNELDRQLVGDLRELHLLLTVDPVAPERRNICSYMLYQQRVIQAAVVEQAINRLIK